MDFNTANLNIDISKDSNKKIDVLKNTENIKTLEKINDNNDKNSKNDNNGYDERINKLLDKVNQKFKFINKEFSYDLHEKTQKYIVKVKNSETGDIIREIPSKESLDLFAKMLEMAGLLVDEKS